VWRVDTDGSNLKQLTHERLAGDVNCSRDRRWVYFRNRKEPRPIERLPIERGNTGGYRRFGCAPRPEHLWVFYF
jgi:hypothetical protein